MASLIIECLIIQCCYWLEKTLTHCHRIWNRKMLSGWWFYAMLIFRLTSVFKKTYSSGPNDFSTLKCFLHFFVGFFSLCCLQRYLKHYMQKVSLEFHMLVWNFIYSQKRIFCRGVYSRISWVKLIDELLVKKTRLLPHPPYLMSWHPYSSLKFAKKTSLEYYLEIKKKSIRYPLSGA